jgi:hypothetical protein
MTVSALCLSTKKKAQIKSRPRVRSVRTATGTTVFITGYSPRCKSAAGKQVKMSRIIRHRHTGRISPGCAAKGKVRSPISLRCVAKKGGLKSAAARYSRTPASKAKSIGKKTTKSWYKSLGLW